MIVARGLGRGAGALLVTFGLGLVVAPQPPAQSPAAALGGGPDEYFDDAAGMGRAERERIQRQNDLIIWTVVAAVTGGMLE